MLLVRGEPPSIDPLPLKTDRQVSLAVNERFLLVADEYSGDTPRVTNLTTGKPWSADPPGRGVGPEVLSRTALEDA